MKIILECIIDNCRCVIRMENEKYPSCAVVITVDVERETYHIDGFNILGFPNNCSFKVAEKDIENYIAQHREEFFKIVNGLYVNQIL